MLSPGKRCNQVADNFATWSLAYIRDADET